MTFHGHLCFHPQMPYLFSVSFVGWLCKHVDIYLPVLRLVLILHYVSFSQVLSIDLFVICFINV